MATSKTKDILVRVKSGTHVTSEGAVQYVQARDGKPEVESRIGKLARAGDEIYVSEAELKAFEDKFEVV